MGRPAFFFQNIFCLGGEHLEERSATQWKSQTRAIQPEVRYSFTPLYIEELDRTPTKIYEKNTCFMLGKANHSYKNGKGFNFKR